MDISFHKLSLLNRWRQHRLFCILFCALVISTSAVYAQSSIPNYDFKFKAVGIKEGLSQSTVLSIYQDHYGLMWLGTRNGLNRFDGHSVKVFRNEIGNQHTLAGNTVNKIQEDRERRLWIATDEGLSLFDRKTERFHNFTLPEKNRKEIVDLVIDANGKIWVGSADGLFIFDPAINKFNRAEDRGLYAGIANQYISMLHMEDGKLYIGTNNNGVYLVDTKNRKASHFSADIFEKYSAGGPIRINDVAIDKKGAIWIGTNGSGLYRLNRNGSWNWFSRSNLTPNFKITDNLVRSLTTDFDGNIWVGTFNGLNRIDALGRIQHINYSDRTPSGISHGSIRSLFTTKDGSVWIGTYFGGVNILDQQQENFKHYYHISDSQNSLSYNVVGAFTAISPNRVLIGTERGGINLLDESTGFVKPLQLNLKDNLTIKSLFTSSKGETYVGLFKAGLHQLMLADNKLIPLAVGTNHRLKEAIINSIVEDAEHHLWIGTDGLGGVHRYNTQTRDYEEFKGGRQLQTLLNKVLVKHLYLDEKQTLWIATRGMGLISFDLGTGRIGSYPSVSSISNAVNSISPDRKGGLWLATNGKGVIHFNPQSKKVQHIHAKDGLLNNNVFSIFPWKDNLWISTLTGLSHYSLNKKLFRNYESGGSFPLSELNEGIFFKSPKGRLYIGGNNGLVSFDPAMASKVDSSGTVLVTQVNVLGQHAESIYFLDGKESVDQEIQLRHDQPVFSIDFTSLNYLKPQMDRYSYRLLGLDDSWYALKDRRSIIFSNLPSGEYTFEVRSSSNGVDWVLSNNKINIRVLPAPWLTWWAIALYVIIGVGIIFAIRANELNKGKLQTNLKFEQLEKQRWKEIHDLKLKYFTDVSHEFRTPLTLISGPVEELMEEKGHSDWVKDKLKLVFYNSKRLLLLIDQILDANKIDANRLELHLNSVSINELLSNITNNFIGMADRLGIDLQLEQQEIAGHFDVDIDKFEKILYNLLSNAFKFTSKGGKIIVSYTTESKNEQTWFHFKISDTGVGMTEEEAAKIFERFYKVNAQDSGAGIGLSLTYSLVQLMNGEISVKSTPEKGSTFELSLPFAIAEESTSEPEFVRNLPAAYVLDYTSSPIVDEEDEKEGQPLILIAEDNKEINEYLLETLQSENFKVISAMNGAKAWELAEKKIPDLVITDVLMPKMGGLELCGKLKNEPLTSHIPVIMLTAKTDDQSKIEGLEIGADDYLSKPFLPKELLIKIKNILKNRKILQEKFQGEQLNPVEVISINKYDRELFQKINKVIEANIKNPALSVEFIGDQIGMSREHLFRKLKAIAGTSPSEFIRSYRLNRAAQLLVEQQLTVADAADEVGYNDVQYFSKSFRKKFNCSPNQYAKKN